MTHTHRLSVEFAPQESFVVAQFARHLVSDQEEPHVSWQFLMDLAVVILHQTSEGGNLTGDAPPESVPMTEQDILSLRELVPVTATVGTTPVGLSIHRKLYEVLLRLHPDQAAEVQFGTEEEPSKEEYALELRRLKRRARRWKK